MSRLSLCNYVYTVPSTVSNRMNKRKVSSDALQCIKFLTKEKAKADYMHSLMVKSHKHKCVHGINIPLEVITKINI